jgi:adenylate kinase
MAPILESAIDDLKSTIARLEARIVELEHKQGGGSGAAPSITDGVRMILMGPPGAGKFAQRVL